VSGVGPVCVGREPALAVLRGQLAMAVRGAARIVWIDGSPGMGKTTLVRAFLAETRHRSAWATGDEEETSLPYGVLATLQRAIAVAADSPGPVDDVPSAQTDPLAAGAELLVALGGLDDPLVLVIDDLQWADTQSASALRFALRRLLAERLLVVLITRPNAADYLGESWTRLLADPERVTRVHLDGLTTEGMVQLLAASGHGRLDRPVAERLSEHTGGNPLHARALIDELGDSGLRAGGVLPAPRSFAQLTIGRLVAMDGEAVQLATAGAVLGSRFSVPLAALVGGVADPVGALDSAVAAGLLERAPEGHARFTHPLVRGAVYNDLSAARLRSLHLAAADATTGTRSLEHRVSASAGSNDDLAQELEHLARKELASGAPIASHDHLVVAASISSTARDRDRRVLSSVEAVVGAGDYPRAAALRPIVMACAESAHRSYVLGLIDLDFPAEVHLSAAAAADNDGDIPSLRIKALGVRSIVRLRLGQFEAALRDAETTLELSVGTWGIPMVRWVQVVCLAQLGRTADARDALDRLVPRPDGPAVDLDLLGASGLMELVDDDLGAAQRVLTELAERARAGEACRVLIFSLCVLAVVQYQLGRWDESAMSSELALALGDPTPGWWTWMAHTAATFVHAGRGRFDVAEEHVQVAGEVVRSLQTPFGLYQVAVARAVLAQSRGQMDELRAATAPMLDGSLVPTVVGLDRWGWQVLAIEGLLGTGELPAARKQLAELADLVSANGLVSAATDIARLEGQLAEASDDPDSALAAYAVGLQPVDGRGPLPLPKARLALAYGSLLRRTGARRAAVEQLRTAHAALTALGAAPFLATCDAELSACGLQAPTADPSGRLTLTPTEQTVAHLVAQGLTNREAATRLYVSPKTVDYHLGNIYAKLGITSRRDLAGRLKPGA
jgi:DNA-binding CsgD family transcriptional regulator